MGVAGSIIQRQILQEAGPDFGQALEHYVLMEILAYIQYRRLDIDVSYWRTKSGLEVDFIIGQGVLAIEVKGSPLVHLEDLRGLRTFRDEHAPKQSIVVCNENSPRTTENILFLPIKIFLEQLWSGQLIK